MSDTGWQGFGINPDGLVSVAQELADALDPAITTLETVTDILEAVSQFFITFDGVLDTIISQAINIIKDLIGDILNRSVALCVHSNIRWDDNWTWAPTTMLETVEGSTADQVRNPNYTEDGDLPWTGTGINGWLTEILGSTLNGGNEFAPRTDGDTPVNAFILVFGLGDISAFIDQPENIKKFFSGLGIQPAKMFLKERWDFLSSDAGKTWLKAKDTYSLPVDTPRIQPTIRGQLDGIEDFFSLEDSESFASSTPAWMRASAADILGPASKVVFSQLDQIADFLKSLTDSSPLVKLIEALVLKIEKITDMIKKLDEALDALVELIQALQNLGSYIVIRTESGGIQEVIRTALSAQGIPDYGAKGVVLGTCAVALGDTSADQIDKLLTLFGNTPAKLGATFTQSKENIESITSSVQTSSGTFNPTWSS